MRELADNGAYALMEQGARLMFFHRRGLVPPKVVFLAGLLTFVLAVQGIVFAFVPHWRSEEWPGLLAGAALAGVVVALLVRQRRAVLARPLDPRDAIVVLDLAAGLLTDAAGTPLAPLDRVRFERAFQLITSSRKLCVSWPGGGRVVYRSDWLTGLLDVPLDELAARGLRCS